MSRREKQTRRYHAPKMPAILRAPRQWVILKIARLHFQIPLPVQRLSIFSISSPERAKKLSIGVHGFCGKQRKSTASVQGEGKRALRARVRAVATCRRRCSLGTSLAAAGLFDPPLSKSSRMEEKGRVLASMVRSPAHPYPGLDGSAKIVVR